MTNPSPTYTITITDQDLQIIMKGLEEQPFKFSAPLVNKIAGQLNAQIAPPAPVPETPIQPE